MVPSAIDSRRFRHEPNHRNPPWEEATAAAESRARRRSRRRAGRRRGSADGLRLASTSARAPTDRRPRARARRSGALLPAAGDERRREGGPRRCTACTCTAASGVHRHAARGWLRGLPWVHSPLSEVSATSQGHSGAESCGWRSSSGVGYEVALLEFGEHSAEAMLTAASQSQSLWTAQARWRYPAHLGGMGPPVRTAYRRPRPRPRPRLRPRLRLARSTRSDTPGKSTAMPESSPERRSGTVPLELDSVALWSSRLCPLHDCSALPSRTPSP